MTPNPRLVSAVAAASDPGILDVASRWGEEVGIGAKGGSVRWLEVRAVLSRLIFKGRTRIFFSPSDSFCTGEKKVYTVDSLTVFDTHPEL